ncbi:coiled-coil-helix-coiled-coil-helix domain-containing protein 7 [Hyalella azteca]|uniref:Coiled-coil-helix-coiled-coil-helix domain-containing protein 7 n=1 Tax=Hyalella azteca TaxID=294128 RepID=A0A8B7MYU8_HYAAZ|nr:coiled-coil-helix-coiled-coil-helix domain-containing protein 7 [Hyalella azteca]
MDMTENKPTGRAVGGHAMSREKLTRALDDRNNPCVKEHNLTHQCLDRNNFDHAICRAYFENYKVCKKFWGDISLQRRRAGLKPYLPTPEERPAILLSKKL